MAVVHEVQGRIGRMVITPAATLALLAGVYLASTERLWSEPWVIVPFVILICILGLSGAVLAPAERRLAQLAGRDAAGPEYDAAFRRLVTTETVLFGAVLVAIFLMVAKPGS